MRHPEKLAEEHSEEQAEELAAPGAMTGERRVGLAAAVPGGVPDPSARKR